MAYIHLPRHDLSVHARDLFHDAEEGRARNISSAMENGYIRDINQPLTIARETALHVATIQNNTITAQKILDLGGDPNQPTSGGETPFIIAARTKNADLIDAMVEKNANPNHGDQLGNSALHWVARHGDIGQLWTLLDVGGDVTITNHRNETPLDWGVLNPDKNVPKLLVAYGADPKSAMIDGKTAIDRAASCGKEDLATWLSTAIPRQVPEILSEPVLKKPVSVWREAKTAQTNSIAYRR